MNSTIIIKDLALSANIGIYEHEKVDPCPLWLDLSLNYDIRKAAETDSIEDTINYKKFSDDLKNLVSQTNFNLVEALASYIADYITERYNVKHMTLTLWKKPANLLYVDRIAIQITR